MSRVRDGTVYGNRPYAYDPYFICTPSSVPIGISDPLCSRHFRREQHACISSTIVPSRSTTIYTSNVPFTQPIRRTTAMFLRAWPEEKIQHASSKHSRNARSASPPTTSTPRASCIAEYSTTRPWFVPRNVASTAAVCRQQAGIGATGIETPMLVHEQHAFAHARSSGGDCRAHIRPRVDPRRHADRPRSQGRLSTQMVRVATGEQISPCRDNGAIRVHRGVIDCACFSKFLRNLEI